MISSYYQYFEYNLASPKTSFYSCTFHLHIYKLNQCESNYHQLLGSPSNSSHPIPLSPSSTVCAIQVSLWGILEQNMFSQYLVTASNSYFTFGVSQTPVKKKSKHYILMASTPASTVNIECSFFGDNILLLFLSLLLNTFF